MPSTARVERGPSQGARSASRKGTWLLFTIYSKLVYFTSLGMALVVVQLRTSSEHIPIVRAPGARDHASVIPRLPLLNLRPSTDYPSGMELPDLKDDPYLKVLRPLVEAYLAFWRIDIRHIKSLQLTPSQFDVIATLGDTEGMTCSELSAQTLVTKGTLTGVLDRLVSKGLIRRDAMKHDRRCTKISLTAKGEALFRKTFAAHMVFLRPFFERALSREEVNQTRTLLLRLRDSFQQ
ncbi:MAG: MarR family transcriptional regulator [Nitrospirota bacterium]